MISVFKCSLSYEICIGSSPSVLNNIKLWLIGKKFKKLIFILIIESLNDASSVKFTFKDPPMKQKEDEEILLILFSL